MPLGIQKTLAQGKPNSLGRTQEVIELVLKDQNRLPELFETVFDKDENVRLRAGDALEKICRQHPDWLAPYTNRLLNEVTKINQNSLRWHLAQMFSQLPLTPTQTAKATALLKNYLKGTSVDWIVAGYSMETLAKFAADGKLAKKDLARLLIIQQGHHSKAVVRRATKLLNSL